MADGFLGRWSQRKQDAKEGKAGARRSRRRRAAVPPVPAAAALRERARAAGSLPAGGGPRRAPAPNRRPPSKTSQALTPDSDFTPLRRPPTSRPT